MPNLVGIGNSQVPTNSMLGGLAYQDSSNAHLKNVELGNISKIKSEIYTQSAYAVFLYDTTKDSDGGAWRKRCQDKTWYSEVPSMDRGQRREFPSLAIIVGESNASYSWLTIYDGDDPTTPMWMVFRGGTSHLWANINSIHAINGDIFVGLSEYGVVRYSLLGDSIGRWRVSGNSSWGFKQPREIIKRNTTAPTNNAQYAPFGGVFVADNVGSVYAMALHDAPIDPYTGIQKPTVCVVTKNGNTGGLTIIHDDDTTTSATHGYASSMVMGMCPEQEVVIIGHNGATSGQTVDVIDVRTQKRRLGPGHQVIGNVGPVHNTNASGTYVGRYYGYGAVSEPGPFKFNSWGLTTENPVIKEGSLIFGTGNKLIRIAENIGPDLQQTNDAGYDTVGTNTYGLQSSMVNLITHQGNSGWMHGNCHVCLGFGAEGDTYHDVALSNGGQYSSIAYPTRNFTATSNGGLKYKRVAPGADLLAYSGFDSNNYLRRNETFTGFGDTSCIVMMAWSKTSYTSAYQYLMNLQSSSTHNGCGLAIFTGTGIPYFWDHVNSSTDSQGSISIADGEWHHVCAVADWGSSAVQKSIYVDGSLAVTASKSVFDLNPIDNWNIGHYTPANASPSVSYPHQGQLALVKISGGGATGERGVPTADQIKKIYEDELPLFQPNANCVLYGSSSDVKAIAYDDDTNILYAGTTSGRSDFRGLKRINNTTNAITSGKTISAAKGMVVEV